MKRLATTPSWWLKELLDPFEPFDERPARSVLDEAAGLEGDLDLLLKHVVFSVTS